MGGKYVPSLLAAIGQVLEDHMIANGFMTDEGALSIDEALRQSGVFKAGAGSKKKGRREQCRTSGNVQNVARPV